MSTYYTPELEEFRIGFQYEWLNEDKEWVKVDSPEVITPDGYDEQFYGLRVKHLDREDIEGEGWNMDQETKDGAFFFIGEEGYWGDVYSLVCHNDHLRFDDNYTKIRIHRMFGDKGIIFDGIILNLSVFRELMKQLNIKKA